MSEQNLSLVRRWFDEVWNHGRHETIHELMSPDAIGIGQGGAEAAIHGPGEFQAFVERLRAAFPDMSVNVEDAFGAGDKVAVRWSATMTHQGGDLGIPASGKRVHITGISILRIVDGQIVAGWDNWDELGMMRQIGALQQPNVASTTSAEG